MLHCMKSRNRNCRRKFFSLSFNASISYQCAFRSIEEECERARERRAWETVREREMRMQISPIATV